MLRILLKVTKTTDKDKKNDMTICKIEDYLNTVTESLKMAESKTILKAKYYFGKL